MLATQTPKPNTEQCNRTYKNELTLLLKQQKVLQEKIDRFKSISECNHEWEEDWYTWENFHTSELLFGWKCSVCGLTHN